MNSSQTDILTRSEYYNQLAKQISDAKKGDKVIVATLAVKTSDEAVVAVLVALSRACKRGVNVTLLVDAFTFLLIKGVFPGPLFFYPKLSYSKTKFYNKTPQHLTAIKENGGYVIVTNRPQKRFSWPFAGRSHMKFAVINDNVYMGGCNLTRSDHDDIMVLLKDKSLAQKLSGLVQKIHDNPYVYSALNKQDLVYTLSADTDVLLDAGVAGQSKIYAEALQIIHDANESIVMTCQYFPHGRTAQSLDEAIRRGVSVKLFYNSPSKQPFPLSIVHYVLLGVAKTRYSSKLFKNELPRGHNYLHAKVLMTESSILTGSHNYVEKGVQYGTAELAILSKDRKFAQQVWAKVTSQLKVTFL